MNRPKFNLRKNEMFNYFAEINNMAEHIEALEQYCDVLENALDKASKKLAEFDECYRYEFGDFNGKDANWWREWCFMDWEEL